MSSTVDILWPHLANSKQHKQSILCTLHYRVKSYSFIWWTDLIALSDSVSLWACWDWQTVHSNSARDKLFTVTLPDTKIPVKMRCLTRQKLADNYQMLVWLVHRTFARQLYAMNSKNCTSDNDFSFLWIRWNLIFFTSFSFNPFWKAWQSNPAASQPARRQAGRQDCLSRIWRRAGYSPSQIIIKVWYVII